MRVLWWIRSGLFSLHGSGVLERGTVLGMGGFMHGVGICIGFGETSDVLLDMYLYDLRPGSILDCVQSMTISR